MSSNKSSINLWFVFIATVGFINISLVTRPVHSEEEIQVSLDSESPNIALLDLNNTNLLSLIVNINNNRDNNATQTGNGNTWTTFSNGNLQGKYNNCMDVLDNFSESVAVFVWCAVAHARPVGVCESCVELFSGVETSYQSIFEVKVEGKYCNEVLLNVDKLQVVPTLYTEVLDLWSKANCNACFNITKDSEGRKIYRLLDRVEKFDTYIHAVLDCIKNVSNETISPLRLLTEGRVENTSIVCTACKEAYTIMNQFYQNMVVGGMDSVCMDVTDIVNSSRSLWSSHYHCLIEHSSTRGLYSTMGCMCALPIIFYLTLLFLSARKETKLAPQKRLAWFQGSSKITLPRRTSTRAAEPTTS